VQSVKDLKLSCCFFSVKLFGFLKADAGMAGLARLNLNGFLKILTFVSSQAPLIYLTPQFRFLQQVYIQATLNSKFIYSEKAKQFEEISLLVLTLLNMSSQNQQIQIFVAFSEKLISKKKLVTRKNSKLLF
jgi:hypothetical protein